ncbi:MAG: HD domain-containing protein [Clostridia bacterium]|nr:HD domain-containing protein [Clostridia bacterium]
MSGNNIFMAKKIAELVSGLGGKTYYVGGMVRDELLGIENKDVDIEVHGITPEQLESILDSVGEKLKIGTSFGIFGLRGYDIDIAMPRREHATGRGHRDFEVFVDPFLGAEKAAMRRDFTINALMKDVITGEIADFFGGIRDLNNGILRHVNDSTFVEDPLRALRACQFAARFNFEIAPETVEIIKTMSLDALAKERVLGELKKAFLKAEKPSVFFEYLKKAEQLGPLFPELYALIGVEQPANWHPEGDVFNHTMLVLDAAAKLKNGARNPFGFMLSALCHDFGKAVTQKNENGKITFHSHETEGLPLIKSFLRRLTDETELIKYVLNLCELHMRPNQLAAFKSSRKALNKLFYESADPEALVLLAEADALGCGGREISPENREYLLKGLEAYNKTMAKPCVLGADLIKAGLTPGVYFSELLEYATKLRLAGIEKENALKQTLAYAKSKGYYN